MTFFEVAILLLFVLFSVVLVLVKAFDFYAIVISLFMGAVIFSYKGIEWFIALFLFFIFGLLSTYYGRKKRKASGSHKTRDFDNVISNGLVAFTSALFNFPFIYLGSIVSALADTMSSEIGMLSKKKPVLILNPWKEVKPGTNGGVSQLGFFAAIVGSLVIAAFAYIFYSSFLSPDLHFLRGKLAVCVFIGGIVGTVADSFLGQVFENREKMTNGSVNFISTLIAGFFVYLTMMA
ncbi:MAG: hypothetical protein DRN66_01595 [Candidatus Nanohalarchaeota archaeon]|nr:MAG: hypothetical protein DRN66_01595 [Candidatus Nanohaloarchaeota archaeon]